MTPAEVDKLMKDVARLAYSNPDKDTPPDKAIVTLAEAILDIIERIETR
jgi:hypothetical protein